MGSRSPAGCGASTRPGGSKRASWQREPPASTVGQKGELTQRPPETVEKMVMGRAMEAADEAVENLARPTKPPKASGASWSRTARLTPTRPIPAPA